MEILQNKVWQNGSWLFGNFCIADAMFAPVVIRFNGYGVSLEGIEKEYMDVVLGNPCLIDWMEAGRQEKEVIEMFEIKP